MLNIPIFGLSGLETAALLHEAGAELHLVARAPPLKWHDPPQRQQPA